MTIEEKRQEKMKAARTRMRDSLLSVILPVGMLAGLDTVRDCMKDDTLRAFLGHALLHEIMPCLGEHRDILDPVAMAGIPTRLRCTAHPEQLGTLIDDRVEDVVPCIAALANGLTATITVFGMPQGRVRSAAEGLETLAIRASRDRIEVDVAQDALPHSIRALHRRLIEAPPGACQRE